MTWMGANHAVPVSVFLRSDFDGNLCLGGVIGRFVKQVQNSGPGGNFGIEN